MARGGRCERAEERSRGVRAVGVARLPVVAELGDGLLLAARDEHRIEPESFGPSRLVGDATVDGSGAAKLAAVGRKRDELADVTRAAPLVVTERVQHPADLVACGAASRAHAGAAVEPVDLDPRVLSEHPRVGGSDLAPEPRLRSRV